jgi:hypothetical protein
MACVSRRLRCAAVLASALLAALVGLLSATAPAASASVDPPTSTRYFHTCIGIGDDGTSRAVVCADLWSFPFHTGTEFFGQNEVYCQNLVSRDYVQCHG